MMKKMLMTGLVIASMVTVAACSNKGSGQTTTTATAVESSMDDVAQTSAAESERAESGESTTAGIRQETSKTATEETAKELQERQTAEVIRSFTEEVQITVSEKDLDALADLSEFPLTVKLADGTEKQVQDKEEFLALGEDAVFSEELLKAIAAVVPEELKEGENGIQMGEIPGIVIDYVEGAPAIVGIYLSK